MPRMSTITVCIALMVTMLMACESPIDVGDIIPDYQRFEVFRLNYDGSTMETHSGAMGTSQGIVYVADRAGRANSAAFFNGQNSVHLSGRRIDGISNDFTMMLWVRPDIDDMVLAERNQGNLTTIPRQTVIFHTHGLTWDNQSAGVGLSVGRNVIHVIEHAHNYQPPVLVKAVALTGWHHVAVVYRAKTPHLYIDGELVHVGRTSTYASVRPGSGSDEVYKSSGIGRGSQNNSFHGAMDEMRIFSRALSDDEVRMVFGR
jgi:hypothetical protein